MRTPLYHCCSNGNLPISLMLISLGADIHTTLFAACETGSIHVVKTLISMGLDVSKPNSEGNTCNHNQQMLAPISPNIDCTNNLGQSPLHHASRLGHARIVDTLLSYHASPHATDLHTETPLHLASLHPHTHLIESLITHGADIHLSYASTHTFALYVHRVSLLHYSQ